MAGFVEIRLLMFLLSFICASEHLQAPQIGFEGSVSRTGNEHGSAEHSVVDTAVRYDAEMSHMMETHWLRMLNLSSRPRGSVTESSVPFYMRALRNAVDTAPLSSAESDQLMWAVKAMQVSVTSDVVTSHFSLVAKSGDITPWRVELVLESPSSLLARHSSRGRTVVDVCHTPTTTDPPFCLSRHVRWRQYYGLGRQYGIYNVTAVVTLFWYLCHPNPCRLEIRVHRPDEVNAASTLMMLVVYENVLPDVRATRRALKTISGNQESSMKTTNHERSTQSSRDERYRRGASTDDGYCQLYKWKVDFGMLNWTWVVAPHQFEAGYCAGRCPTGGGDLDRVSLTNHAFMRMVHRAWQLDVGTGRLPAPSCVPIRYRQLSILYQTDEKTFELRHVNDMVTTACGCL